jgi:hypothetical protein
MMLLLIAGCAAGAPGPLRLTLGGAHDDGSGFLPLSGDVDLVPGAQGGFHLWLKYRLSGVDRQVHVIRSAVRVSDGRAILNALPLVQTVTDPFESPEAMPSFMCPTPIGVRVYDEEVELRLQIRDGDATLAEGSARVIARCPPNNDFCPRICGG